MIAPATLQELIASSPVEALRDAIVIELRRLLKGVTIVSHPGKVDMNDLLAKTIVAAPGIALGWSRLRALRDTGGGTFEAPIDWVAYVVVEDFADTKATPPRAVPREIVAMAIGARMLAILQDDEAQFWGTSRITAPSADTPPELRPLLTIKSEETAASVYTLAWSQSLILQGTSPFDGPTPAMAALPDGMAFDTGDELPPQIRALLQDDEAA